MSRTIRSDSETVISDNEFIIELRIHDVPLFALEVTMLLMGLVKELSVIFGSGSVLQVLIGDGMLPGDKAIFTKNKNLYRISTSTTHLEYLSAVLLRAYRDQMAEVNHIHIEGERNGDRFDLILLFECYADSLTPEDAFRLMGE